MTEELLATLMTGLDPVRNLTDSALNELVPTDRIMANVLSKIDSSIQRVDHGYSSIWHRVSFRVGAVAAAFVVLAAGVAAMVNSVPSPQTSGLAPGTVHDSWIRLDSQETGDYVQFDTVTSNMASLFVTKGRISKVLRLPGITITPPPSNIKTEVPASQMSSRLWATTSLQGQTEVGFGIGSITLTNTRRASSTIRKVPVWIAIATSVPCHSARACQTVSAVTHRPLTLVINGYGLSMNKYASGAPVAFSYSISKGSAEPVLRPAIEQVSVRWIQDGPVSKERLRITTAAVPCGALDGYSLTDKAGETLLVVKGLVPESTIGDFCPAATVATKTVKLTGPYTGAKKFLHASVGALRATSAGVAD